MTNIWPLTALVDVLAIIFKSKLAVSRGTNTGKGSDEIFAAEFTVVCFGPALINISTVMTIRGHLVAIRTDTSI